jgi:hypothetical protein
MAKGTTKPQQKSANHLDDPDERKKLKTGLATITHQLQEMDNLKEGIQETIEDVAISSGLDKKIVRKMANTMYKHNYGSLVEENNHFCALYEMIVEGRLRQDNDPLAQD